MNRIWYRNTTWNEEIENSFFKKLGRVKDKSMRAQYLKLQAGSLAYTKVPALMDVAEKLLNKQLTEYSDVVLFVSSAYGLLGDIQGFKELIYIKKQLILKQRILIIFLHLLWIMLN